MLSANLIETTFALAVLLTGSVLGDCVVGIVLELDEGIGLLMGEGEGIVSLLGILLIIGDGVLDGFGLTEGAGGKQLTKDKLMANIK